MLVTIILIFVAVALFLIFRDDHDDSYTKGDRKTGRDSGQKSVYKKSVENRRNPATSTPRSAAPQPQASPRPAPAQSRPSPFLDSRTIVPKEKEYRKPLDFHFLDQIGFDESLPDRTMSSFIAGIQGHCSEKDLGGLVGYITMDRNTGGMEVHDHDGRLLGYLPMKDRVAFHAFNPGLVTCPFAGHLAHSVTGSFYADIRIVLPSTRDFVEESLTGFLG
jgi:hypothetical protein